METSITIEGRTLGRKAPLFADWSIPRTALLPDEAETLTLRTLIAGVVRDEVEAFRARQEERRLVRVLTRGVIEQGVAAGKVDMGGRDLAQAVDADAAVAAALQAFEDRLYLVFVDGREETSLDAAVNLASGSRVSFVRLVALAGG